MCFWSICALSFICSLSKTSRDQVLKRKIDKSYIKYFLKIKKQLKEMNGFIFLESRQVWETKESNLK
jgi:hypothetical protein